MVDRRIARAAHPIINAWRCQVGNVLHQGEPYFVLVFDRRVMDTPLDNDDDGETAAGGRLAHLLQILVGFTLVPFMKLNCIDAPTTCVQEVNNVLVVVTRYFGGIHLGADRFKHINQAARNALELGGFLDAPEKKVQGGRGKRH